MISEKSKTALASLGLQLRGEEENLSIAKAKGWPGNHIPEWRQDEGKSSDCPELLLRFREGSYQLSCWDWAPGPGPGDFEQTFAREEEVVDFVKGYFFEENEFFEARKNHERLHRNSVNLQEIQEMLNHLQAKLMAEFGTGDIQYGERATFHKIPMDAWRIRKQEEEEHQVSANIGFLSHEVSQVRTKIFNQEALSYQEVNSIANLIFELSIHLKDR